MIYHEYVGSLNGYHLFRHVDTGAVYAASAVDVLRMYDVESENLDVGQYYQLGRP